MLCTSASSSTSSTPSAIAALDRTSSIRLGPAPPGPFPSQSYSSAGSDSTEDQIEVAHVRAHLGIGPSVPTFRYVISGGTNRYRVGSTGRDSSADFGISAHGGSVGTLFGGDNDSTNPTDAAADAKNASFRRRPGGATLGDARMITVGLGEL